MFYININCIIPKSSILGSMPTATIALENFTSETLFSDPPFELDLIFYGF